MAITHTYQIIADGINAQGEINIGNGEAAKVKSETVDNMTLKQHQEIQNFFNFLIRFNKTCKNLTKIEINKK
jgi:hypothetical protein